MKGGTILLFIVLASLTGVSKVRGDAKGVNSVAFAHMCAAYNLAISDPQLPWTVEKASQSPEEKAAAAMKKLLTMELALTRQDIFDMVSEAADYENTCAKSSCKEELTDTKWVVFKGLKRHVKLAQSSEKVTEEDIVRPENEGLRKSLRRQIGLLVAKAETLQEKIGELQTETTNQRLNAIENLRVAAFGTEGVKTFLAENGSNKSRIIQMKEANTKSFVASNARENACGQNQWTATSVGISIASDTVCLCTLASAAHTEGQLCTKDALKGLSGLNSNEYSSGSADTKGLNAWNVLVADCPKEGSDTFSYGAVSPAAIHEAIYTFRGDLGKGGMTTGTESSLEHPDGNNRFILGVHGVDDSNTDGPKCTGALGSAGSLQDQGVCIDYRSKLGKGLEIPWVLSLKKASTALQAMHVSWVQASRLLTRLDGIVTTAHGLLVGEHAGGRPASSTSNPTSKGFADKSGNQVVQHSTEGKEKAAKAKAILLAVSFL